MNNTMKKIFSILTAGLLVFSLFSCDLTRDPDGQIEQGPLKTIKEIRYLGDGLYTHLRTAEVPLNTSYSDYQAGYYVRTIWDGGQVLGMTDWEESRMLSDERIDNYFAAYSILAMQANYFISRAQEALDNDVLEGKAKDIKATKTLIAEAKVMKAVSIYRLMLRYAKGPYNPATAAQEMGVFLMDEFSPLAKPERASKLASYSRAIELIDEAIALGLNEKSEAPYHINIDYAYALKARIYLQMQEWQKAVDAVGKFIDKYPLVDTKSEKTAADKVKLLRSTYSIGSSENVLTLYADAKVGSFGQFYGWLDGVWQPEDELDPNSKLEEFILPNAILSDWAIKLYDDKDIRKEAYVGEYKILAQLPVHMLTKYMGDPALDVDKEHTRHRNRLNLFNIAEAYLIRAEAYLQLKKQTEAQNDLEALMGSRGIEAPEFGSITSDMKLLREERARELIGEGMRLNDMYRWGLDFVAPSPQSVVAPYSTVSKEERVSIEDKRFMWEFPSNDRRANPNLHGKSNWD